MGERLIFQVNKKGLCTVGPDLRVHSWNHGMAKLTGYSEEEMLQKELFEETYRHLLPMKKVFIKALNEKMPLEIDHWNENRKHWFRISIFPVEQHLLVSLEEVTEEKNRRRELREIKNVHQHVLDSTSDIIWAIDDSYKLLMGNNVFHQLMKKNSGSGVKVGQSVIREKPGDRRVNRKSWKEYYDYVLRGNSFVATLPDRAADSIFEVNFEPIRCEKNKPIGVACFARDVSERVKHREAIEKQNARLREIAWLQSHEVRAPLSNVLGLIDLLENSEKKEEREQLLELLKASAAQLDRVVMSISEKISED